MIVAPAGFDRLLSGQVPTSTNRGAESGAPFLLSIAARVTPSSDNYLQPAVAFIDRDNAAIWHFAHEQPVRQGIL